MLPLIMDASSERISPNIFEVRITSNWPGLRTSCMAQLSTYKWFSSTSGYSCATLSTVARHRRELSSTLALSTLHSFRERFCAMENATRAMRSISGTLYCSVS